MDNTIKITVTILIVIYTILILFILKKSKKQ